ncbi:MAG: hypothetical protein AB7S41_02340 [Parvibaculaceae bacterium]
MSALLKVPDNLSAVSFVEARWKEAEPKIIDGENAFYEVESARQYLETCEAQIRNRQLDPAYDWEFDLGRAKTSHGAKLLWVETIRQQRTESVDRWKEVCTELTRITEGMIHSGLRMMFLAHGAVGLSAFGALASATPGEPAYVAAIIAAIGALAGFTLAAASNLILVVGLSRIAGRVRNRISATMKMRTFSALAHYFVRETDRISHSADPLAYLSIFALPVYGAAALVALLSG